MKVEKGPYNSNRDSNTFTNNSQSSPGLASIDSAVESWDSQPPESSVTRDSNMSPGNYLLTSMVFKAYDAGVKCPAHFNTHNKFM